MAKQPVKKDDPNDPGLREALKTIIGRLAEDAADRVQKRQQVEKRWLEDTRQLQSRYDADTIKALQNAKKSELFINATWPKTNTCESKLSDMLFPTDEKNWGLSSTPVPTLETESSDAERRAQDLVDQANQARDDGRAEQSAALADQADGFAQKKKEIDAKVGEARRRAELMEDEIHDQLVECKYATKARDVIHDGSGIGTGVMKGPVGSSHRSRRSWSMEQDGRWQLDMVEDQRPAFYRVDPWGFFPETDARTLDESGSFFERHLKTPKKMRDLAKEPGFDKDAIRRVLKEKPETMPTYLSDLRAITGDNPAPVDSMYQVWEYHGPLSAEDMRVLCTCLERDKIMEAVGDEIDPLAELNVVVWFCQGEVLKFGIHHLDSGEAIYSVYNLIKDDTSIWGFGVPYIVREAQKSLNGAWRMMMDNAGLSSGPQIEVDRNVVEPADGDWGFTARKVWLRIKGAAANLPGIKTYNIESHQAELQAIVEMSKSFIDEVSNISLLAQGEQGAHTTDTKGGIALLMNAVNVIFRGFVKNFDDDITVPNIRRMYDWNMQFSEREEIKGDYDVDAKGSSVLLVREIQSQNLLVLANMTDHPVLGILLNAAGILRQLAKSMMLAEEEVVNSDEKIQELAQQQLEQQAAMEQQQGGGAEALAAKEIDAQARMYVADKQQETALISLAEQRNINFDKLKAMLEERRMKNESDERKLAVEAAVQQRRDAQAPNVAASGGGSI